MILKLVQFDVIRLRCLPFCGYNMGEYFAHWINIGTKSDATSCLKIFYVNWFRKGAEGKWLWPGYGENSRVLKWIFERTEGKGKAVETLLVICQPVMQLIQTVLMFRFGYGRTP